MNVDKRNPKNRQRGGNEKRNKKENETLAKVARHCGVRIHPFSSFDS
jgi:hypothetical protein